MAFHYKSYKTKDIKSNFGLYKRSLKQMQIIRSEVFIATEYNKPLR